MAMWFLQGFFLFSYLTGGNSFPPPLKPEEERQYLEVYATGSPEAKEEAKNILIERNLRLVAYLVKKYSNHAKISEDFISIGTIGLIKAITSYKLGRGVKLATYAARCIENEILMHIRANKRHLNDVSLQDIVGVDKEGNEVRIEDKIPDEEESVEEQVMHKLQSTRLYQAIKKVLNEREKKVIEMRYGLSGYEMYTQRDIGNLLDISRSYVSRIEKKALGKIFDELAEQAY